MTPTTNDSGEHRTRGHHHFKANRDNDDAHRLPSKRPAAPSTVERCRRAASRRNLLFKVDLPRSLSFCDAAFPDDHEQHEIVYWDLAEFDERPGLFEGVVTQAVELGAQFIHVVRLPGT